MPQLVFEEERKAGVSISAVGSVTVRCIDLGEYYQNKVTRKTKQKNLLHLDERPDLW